MAILPRVLLWFAAALILSGPLADSARADARENCALRRPRGNAGFAIMAFPLWGMPIPQDLWPEVCGGMYLQEGFFWDYLSQQSYDGNQINELYWERKIDCEERVLLIERHCQDARQAHENYRHLEIKLWQELQRARSEKDPVTRIRLTLIRSDPEVIAGIETTRAALGKRYADHLSKLQEQLRAVGDETSIALLEDKMDRSVESGSLAAADKMRALPQADTAGQHDLLEQTFSGALPTFPRSPGPAAAAGHPGAARLADSAVGPAPNAYGAAAPPAYDAESRQEPPAPKADGAPSEISLGTKVAVGILTGLAGVLGARLTITGTPSQPLPAPPPLKFPGVPSAPPGSAKQELDPDEKERRRESEG